MGIKINDNHIVKAYRGTKLINKAYLDQDNLFLDGSNWVNAQLIYSLSNPNTSNPEEDRFGDIVRINEKYAVVGAYFAPDVEGGGRVYIYRLSDGARIYTLVNPNTYGTALADYFGWYIEIDGDYLYVSSHLEDSANGVDSGVVYKYEIATGTLVDTIFNPNPSLEKHFGYRISISQNYIVISSITRDNDFLKMNIFDKNSLQLLNTITASTVSTEFSMAINNQYLVFSRNLTSLIFVYNIQTGNIISTITLDSIIENYKNGVALYNDKVIARIKDGEAVDSINRVFVYNAEDGSIETELVPAQRLSRDDFGASIAVNSSGILAVTQWPAGNNQSLDLSSVSIFDLNDNYNLIKTIPFDLVTFDVAGWSVDISYSKLITSDFRDGIPNPIKIYSIG
jgi:hypothetical protein